MNETAISWTKYTNNPIRFRRREDGKIGWHCEKVSQGCSNCYAETLNMKWGTKDRFDVATTGKMEAFFDDKMMGELYKIKDASAKIFAFDMTDLFGAFIPDYLRAAAWCVILDLSQHTFQLLTKRPESAVQWAERFFLALSTPEFQALAKSVKHPKVKAALNRDWLSADVWASHIWMGTSVEDQKATKRIDALRLVPAKTRFLSCEPLIGSLGDVNLSGISWAICGGESGRHLTDPSHPRWMKQEWARELRDNCVAQGTAFFYKQDSGKVTEQRPYLVEADGTFWRWWQYPGDLVQPVQVNAKGEPIETPTSANVAPAEPLAPCVICGAKDATIINGKPICPDCNARIEAYQARVQSRLERLQAAAEKAQAAARRDLDRAEQMASIIPFGQPILRGHHSEKWDTNYRNRIDKTWRRGFEMLDKVKGIQRRIHAAESNEAISSDDPEAVLKLQAKIEAAETEQAHMKTANAEIRKALKLSQDQRTPALMKNLNVTEATAKALLAPDYVGRVGYPDYKLTNNSANIRRMKERLTELQAKAQRMNVEPDTQTFGDVKLERDAVDNRLRLRFPGKPAPDVIALLKRHGFIWSGLNGAWQRQLNNAAEFAAKQVLEQLGTVETQPIPTFDTGLVYDQPQPKPRNPILCADCGHDFGTSEERATNTSAQVIIHVHNGDVALCGDCFAKRNGLMRAAPAVTVPVGASSETSIKQTQEQNVTILYVIAPTLRVRPSPGFFQSEPIGALPFGSQVTYDGRNGSVNQVGKVAVWFYVTHASGLSGYVSAEYLSTVNPISPDPTPAPRKTRVVDFREVKAHWNKDTQQWDSDEYVYIGRANQYYNLPQSIWHNPYYVAGERGEAQARINVAAFRGYMRSQRTSHLLDKLETLRGKTLVCWCKDAEHPNAPCHGDVLLELLGEKEEVATEPAPVPPVQMRMF